MSSELPPREPCENEDCDLCNPLPRFTISRVSIRRIRHEREIKAATREEALRLYEEGTAWPESYDEQTVETLEEFPVTVELVPSNAPDADKHLICYNGPGMVEAQKRLLSGGGCSWCGITEVCSCGV